MVKKTKPTKIFKEPSVWKPARPKKIYRENPNGKVWRKPPPRERTTD